MTKQGKNFFRIVDRAKRHGWTMSHYDLKKVAMVLASKGKTYSLTITWPALRVMAGS